MEDGFVWYAHARGQQARLWDVTMCALNECVAGGDGSCPNVLSRVVCRACPGAVKSEQPARGDTYLHSTKKDVLLCAREYWRDSTWRKKLSISAIWLADTPRDFLKAISSSSNGFLYLSWIVGDLGPLVK